MAFFDDVYVHDPSDQMATSLIPLLPWTSLTRVSPNSHKHELYCFCPPRGTGEDTGQSRTNLNEIFLALVNKRPHLPESNWPETNWPSRARPKKQPSHRSTTSGVLLFWLELIKLEFLAQQEDPAVAHARSTDCLMYVSLFFLFF